MSTKPFKHLLIEDAKTLKEYLAGYSNDLLTVEDTESTGLKWFDGLLGISLYQKHQLPAFIAVKTPYFRDRGISLKELIPIMNAFHGRITNIIMHNAKYDLGVFDASGFDCPTVLRDTMLAIHLSDADLEKNLEKRVAKDLGYPKKVFRDWVDPDKAKTIKWTKGGKWPLTWDENIWKVFDLETLAEYACEDAYYTLEIDVIYLKKMQDINVEKIHDLIELPLCTVLKDMRKQGVLIDCDYMESLAVPCKKELADLEKKVHNLAGCLFNINSGPQKAEVLFNRMGYKPKFTTEGGTWATDKNALLDLQINQGAEIAKVLLDHSKLKTLYNSFIKAIPMMVDKDGRLRCYFNSEGARTGRFSSNEPNLQNQPNNKKFPVRAAFIPKPGYKFVILDWSQIELRVAAHLSKDPKLIQAFKSGRDIHQEVADMLGCERSDAKAINFGILYGLGSANLSRAMKKPEAYAKKVLADYYATYSRLIEWKSSVENRAKLKGHVRNMFGRVRPLRGVYSKDKSIFSGAMRQAVNTIIQGTAADLMKIGMLKMCHWFIRENIDAHLLLCVHDEVVIEVREDLANMVYWQCKSFMENISPMDVPIIAEGKICDNWAQGKDDTFIGYQDAAFTSTYTAPVKVQVPKGEVMPLWFRTIIMN